MKVRAIARGFYNSDLKEPGEVFDAKDGAKASWFEPVRKPRKKAKKKLGNSNAQEG